MRQVTEDISCACMVVRSCVIVDEVAGVCLNQDSLEGTTPPALLRYRRFCPARLITLDITSKTK